MALDTISAKMQGVFDVSGNQRDMETLADDRPAKYSEAVEKIWRSLSSTYRELRPVAILILPISIARRKRGHYANAAWKSKGGVKDELAISPQLFSDPNEVLATILHEACHAILTKRKIPHCTNHLYHTKEFRDTCLDELGLSCGWRDNRYGWTDTILDRSVALQRYAKELKFLVDLPKAPGLAKKRDQSSLPPKTSLIKLYCNCSIRIGKSQKTTNAYIQITKHGPRNITCNTCGTEFTDVLKARKLAHS